MSPAPVPSVAFVLANYPPHVGGVERHVSHLARELVSRGIACTVFVLDAPGERDRDGIPVIGLGRLLDVGGVAGLPEPVEAAGLARALRQRSITHVSVHTRFFPATWLGLWAGHRAGLPVILTEHGGGHARAGGRAFQRVTRAVDLTAGKSALRRADALLAVSKRAAEFVNLLSGRQAHVCGNGVDASWWAPNRPFQESSHLVFVGRLVAEKGWRDFLGVVQDNPGCRAIVLGDGPDMNDLIREVESRGLGERVDIRGQVGPEEVRAYLRGSVYVNPSLAAEGLQTTLLEAAAAGARIATYDVGGAAEVAATGAAVHSVRQGDLESLRAATGRALAEQWRAPRHMDQFTWPAVTDQYVRVLEEVSR